MKSSSRSSKRKSKHSQKRSKKKTRSSSEKTKKLKQRDQLESIRDEDSVSNSSVSCSSPMDETRSKKRSRSRDKKGRKDKKRRKRSESSGDEDESPRVKKRKRSKKKRGSDSRKKRSVKRRKSDDYEPNDDCEGKEDKVESKERKGREKGKERNASKKSRDKLRRARSVTEPNDESEQDHEGEELEEEKVESKERKGREKGRGRIADKRSRDRSRSCSPSKLRSESNSYCSEERDLEKNNPKRLKSVIVVMKTYETNDEQELNRDDGHKDEIVCDFDDYPSKSNDSNDGVSGREVVSYPHEISSVKRSLEDPNSEFEASDVRTSEVPGTKSQVAEGSGGMTSSLVRSRVDDSLTGTRSEICTDNASSTGDLEAILRQKALENLLKRKGNLSSKIDDDKNTNHAIEMKKPSLVKAQPVIHHKPHDEENVKSVQKVGPTGSSGPSKDNDGHRLSLRKENARPEEKGKAPGDSVNNRPNMGLFTRTSTRKELLGAKNTWKRQLIPQEPSPKTPNSSREMIVNDSKQQFISQKYSQPNLSARQESMSKDSTKDSASPIVDAKGSTEDVDAVAEPSALGERGTNDKTNETDEEAQFQQKTMSVMRGGEMVQVSYKVYIPKKAPALARRQLKR